MLKSVALVIVVAVVLIGAVVAYAATKPDVFRVERSTVIHAPPAKIYALLNDFHGWAAWSPFENLDPAMQRTYSGPVSGPGAVYAWNSAGKAGAGRMEIVRAETPSKLLIQLDFQKPMKTRNTAEFTLAPEGDATRVTWAMYGPNPLIGKVMQLVFSLDGMVGKDFETGLANLKTAAEA